MFKCGVMCGIDLWKWFDCSLVNLVLCVGIIISVLCYDRSEWGCFMLLCCLLIKFKVLVFNVKDGNVVVEEI